MNSKQIIKRLKKEGFQHSNITGDHWKFKKNGKIVVVPHPKKDIPVGTLRNIYRHAGWQWGE